VVTTCIRAALAGAAVAAGLLGATGAQSPSDPGSPRALPAPRVSLDELEAKLRTLSTATDVTAVRAGLGTVIAGLDEQAVLVPSEFEPTYVWLLVKLQALHDTCDEKSGTGNVVRVVNALTTELADALGS
jgi:hypothetical protein